MPLFGGSRPVPEAARSEALRSVMVASQLAARGIADRRVLHAMAMVPRERFVPATLADFAYEDRPLPIGFGQTISQPYVVALMLEAAAIAPDDDILEVGAGSGYAAAVASRLGRRVDTIERLPALAEDARGVVAALGYPNVAIHIGDGSRGWPDRAPYDVILVAARASSVPPPLIEQLAPGGRLVTPVGMADQQHLLCIRRTASDAFTRDDLGLVRFVSLIGAYGEFDANDPPDRQAGKQGP